MAELQDVSARHWDDYAENRPPAYQQQKTAEAIISCRTAKLGGRIDACDECGHERPSYNPCRNRHCPKCQTVRRDQWVQNRAGDLLGTSYFHAAFTIPDPLHEIFRSNENKAYTALFRTSADTLLECSSDPKLLGAKIGFTGVLRTSGQNLSYRPRIHVIVCAGGINDHGLRRAPGHKLFIPVKALSRMFRGKLTEAPKALSLTIRGEDDPKRIADAIDLAWETEWAAYAKKPFRDAGCVLECLGRYTHRTAISNPRILEVEDGKAAFKWRDYRDDNKMKVMVLDADEFIRRFLMHVLPLGFMRIRHYGFLADNGKRERVDHLKRLCGMAPRITEKLTGLELACRLVGRDITKCPACGGDLHPRPWPVQLC